MILKNSIKIICATTPRDISFLPFFHDVVYVFVNVNMCFDLIGIILNILVYILL